MPITLIPGQEKRLDVSLTPVYVPPELARLWGLVKDIETNAGIAGATVKITGPEGTYSTSTDYSGNYAIEDIEPGTYSGIIEHPDYETYTF